LRQIHVLFVSQMRREMKTEVKHFSWKCIFPHQKLGLFGDNSLRGWHGDETPKRHIIGSSLKPRRLESVTWVPRVRCRVPETRKADAFTHAYDKTPCAIFVTFGSWLDLDDLTNVDARTVSARLLKLAVFCT
jgi:hypothetical protein